MRHYIRDCPKCLDASRAVSEPTIQGLRMPGVSFGKGRGRGRTNSVGPTGGTEKSVA